MILGMHEPDYVRFLRQNECTVKYDRKYDRHYVYPSMNSQVIHADDGITIKNKFDTFIPIKERFTVMHKIKFVKRFPSRVKTEATKTSHPSLCYTYAQLKSLRDVVISEMK